MKNEVLNILFIGDIVGKPGRRAVRELLPKIKVDFDIDLTIANGENLSSGNGISLAQYEEMVAAGVDYLTSGNHVWDKQDFWEYLNDPKIKVIRPINLDGAMPGRGVAEIFAGDVKIILTNLVGRVFMKDEPSDPFPVAKKIAEENKGEIIIVDFHAEATSEKVALANYLDGEVTAVIGTHTHVQTADERILPKGSAYITDAGMCGPIDSVIGVKKEIIIEKFLTGQPLSHKVASGDSIFNGCIISIDKFTKKALGIRRIYLTSEA